ncbi:MAG: CoA transferase [Tepidiformaceae bacterium]
MSEATGPLAGLLAIDFATTRAELAGRFLCELGATVIKVEPPGGAAARFLPPFDESKDRSSETSLYWASVGAGKKSVVVDIEDAAARAQLEPLLRQADFLIESFDPGYMATLGLDYEAVAAVNPRIIYASVTPYGQDGPDALSPATDLTLEAAGGLLELQGDTDRPPVPVGYPQASFHAGVQAATDAVIALNERERSGRGQHLDVSMQAAIVWTLMSATGYPPNVHGDPPSSGPNRLKPAASLLPGISFPRQWECKDGYITVQLAGGRVGKTPLQTALGWAAADGLVPEHIRALSWATWAPDLMAGKLAVEDVKTAIDCVRECFQRHTQHELMQMGADGGLLLAPILRVDGLLADPQLKARDYWVEIEGRTHPGIPVRLSGTAMMPPAAAPRLGEHQDLLAGLAAPVPMHVPTILSRRRTFEGLKVADFAWIGVGPIVAKALADHGATVVHVESFGRPDLLRTLGPFKDGIPGLDRAQFMANFNSSKLGINLNLQAEAGRELARKLIDWSDVVTESFTTGAFARLGFSYEALSKDHPDLVMFSTCLRGATGPQCAYGGYGGQGAALAGLYGITGWPDRPPHGPWGAYTDFIAPRYGVGALASALYHRQRTGDGQYIDMSQVEAAIHFLEPLVLDYTVNGHVAEPRGHESPYAAPHGVYRTQGVERFIAIACETAEQWRNLRAVAPLGEFAGPSFDQLEARLVNDDAIDSALAAWCANEDAHELAQRLKRAGVPAALVERPSDLYQDAQLSHRDFFKICNHSEMGPTPYDGPVTLFSETPPAYKPAPCLGEHTEYVLTEILGLSDEQITAYVAAGAIT